MNEKRNSPKKNNATATTIKIKKKKTQAKDKRRIKIKRNSRIIIQLKQESS